MRGISKRFPGVVALNNVSLEARPGEVVALVGENGAGKSTLMKILGGIHQPDAGEIRINGEAVTIHSVNDSMRLGVGFIHQELNTLPNLDVAANVFLGREPRFGGFLNLIDRRRIEAETEKLLKRLGVDVSPRAQVGGLSIAHRQMIEIAKALSLDTRLLIMDEPTSSLTLAETNRLLEVVKDLRSHGVSVIYISHRLGEVTEIADRVVVLRDGANAGTLEREGLNHDRIVQLMVGRDLRPRRTIAPLEPVAVRRVGKADEALGPRPTHPLGAGACFLWPHSNARGEFSFRGLALPLFFPGRQRFEAEDVELASECAPTVAATDPS